jgi:protoheme IX farnesyltransferase
MSTRSAAVETALIGVKRRGADYYELAKPNVVSMVLVTAFVGFYVASPEIPKYLLLIKMLFGTALAAGGTLALNQFMERDTDALMARTRRRPIPDGRVQPVEALCFGTLLALSGLVYLAVAVNFLSRRPAYHPELSGSLYADYRGLCMVVGAVPGALPPVIGCGRPRCFDTAARVWPPSCSSGKFPHAGDRAPVPRRLRKRVSSSCP